MIKERGKMRWTRIPSQALTPTLADAVECLRSRRRIWRQGSMSLGVMDVEIISGWGMRSSRMRKEKEKTEGGDARRKRLYRRRAMSMPLLSVMLELTKASL
jgi:hypothetical protein